MTDPRPRDRDLAREAAIHQAVSTAVYLGMMIGFTVALTRRDWLARQGTRLVRWVRRQPSDAARAHEDREVAVFRRELADYERGQAHQHRPPAGGLYAPPS